MQLPTLFLQTTLNRCSCWMIPRHGQRNGMNCLFSLSHSAIHFHPPLWAGKNTICKHIPTSLFVPCRVLNEKHRLFRKMKHSKNLSSIHNGKTFRGIYPSKAFLHFFCCSRLATLEEFEDKEVEPHGKTQRFRKGKFHTLATRHC